LEKFWPETHQKLKWLSQIEGTSLKFKTRSGSYSGLDASIQDKNNPKNIMRQSLEHAT
jgi:hypothetical protein